MSSINPTYDGGDYQETNKAEYIPLSSHSTLEHRSADKCKFTFRVFAILNLVLTAVLLGIFLKYHRSLDHVNFTPTMTTQSPLITTCPSTTATMELSKELKNKNQQDHKAPEISNEHFCNGNNKKKTFPDVGYATYGYNIIFAYPLANGHDPGLTHPIFKSDYTDSLQSADCRYHIPKGYHIIPDVACVISFSSEVMQNSRQFSKVLSKFAATKFGLWGGKFSASDEYKKVSSKMAETGSVFIVSTAKCNYYVAMMDEKDPPPLKNEFVETVRNMKTVDDAFDFFTYYGTHYLTYALFGARFVYQHKMSKETYKLESSHDMSITTKASYSGVFNIGGEASMDKSRAEAARRFLEKVETETTSIGAPPPSDGNTIVWASTVKETPIPVKYKLNSIEELFTPSFFNKTDIDYNEKKQLLMKAKQMYCHHLKIKGALDSCSSEQLLLMFNRIWPVGEKMKHTPREVTLHQCIEKCLDNIYCVAVHHYPANTPGDSVCNLYKTSITTKSDEKASITDLKTEVRSGVVNSVFIVLPEALKLYRATLKLKNAKLKKSHPARNRVIVTTEKNCRQVCEKDPQCFVFTYIQDAPYGKYNCYTYGAITITCSGGQASTFMNNQTAECNLLESKASYNTVFLR